MRYRALVAVFEGVNHDDPLRVDIDLRCGQTILPRLVSNTYHHDAEFHSLLQPALRLCEALSSRGYVFATKRHNYRLCSGVEKIITSILDKSPPDSTASVTNHLKIVRTLLVAGEGKDGRLTGVFGYV